MVNLYKAQDLALKKGIDRHRIPQEKRKFIPVIIESAQTRNNKNWYGVKYLDMEEVKNYIRNHKDPKPRKPRNNDYKFTSKATK